MNRRSAKEDEKIGNDLLFHEQIYVLNFGQDTFAFLHDRRYRTSSVHAFSFEYPYLSYSVFFTRCFTKVIHDQ